MKKAYIQPIAELVNFSSLEDFLLASEEKEDNPLVPDNGLEGSEGEVKPGDIPGIW